MAKLTHAEFDRQVTEAMEGTLPGQNGQRRLGRSGRISELLKNRGAQTPEAGVPPR